MRSPPVTLTCVCGHAGLRHRDDGSCAMSDCNCKRFSHAQATYARAIPARLAVPRKQSATRGQANTHPARDSRA